MTKLIIINNHIHHCVSDWVTPRFRCLSYNLVCRWSLHWLASRETTSLAFWLVSWTYWIKNRKYIISLLPCIAATITNYSTSCVYDAQRYGREYCCTLCALWVLAERTAQRKSDDGMSPWRLSWDVNAYREATVLCGLTWATERKCKYVQCVQKTS
jgi:hypothetical protein